MDLVSSRFRGSSNTLSMVGEKIVHTALNFFVFTAMARSLGPEAFGTFSLIQAVFLVGFHVAQFFSEQSIIKLMASQQSSIDALYKKLIVIKFIASGLIYVFSLVLCVIFFDVSVVKIVAIYCAIHLVNVDFIYFSYFRAQEKSWVVLKSRMSVLVPFALVKLIVILNYDGLLVISMVFLLEAILLGLLSFYTYQTSIQRTLEVDFISERPGSSGKEVAKKSQTSLGYAALVGYAWPIFGSALLITLYSRVDQFMIESILGTVELGIYSTAVKLSEASTYVVVTIIASRFPRLMRLKAECDNKFQLEIIYLLRLSLVFSMGILLVFYFFAQDIVLLLFGIEYIDSIGPLIVHMAGTTFIYYGVICTQYLIAKNLEIFRFYRVLFGLLINIVLNLAFIPKYGLMGAALSTLGAQALSTVFFNLSSPKTMPIFKLQMSSILFWRRLPDKVV